MIALDAMGGDFAPAVAVEGAINAARRGISIGLFGPQAILEPMLTSIDVQWRSLPITLIHCSQAIGMAEEPGRSVLKKTDASLVRAVQAVAQGHATAVVSAGNSGAALVAGTLILGRVEGVARPAFGDFLPTCKGSVFCLDLGANTDCKPEYLEQFALMGYCYAKQMKGIAHPRVALLSNGAEPYKGSSAVKEAYARLAHLPINFVGNIESRDVLDDHADVVVCDGFAGNVMLKAMQGSARTMMSWLKQEAAKSWWRKLALLSAAPLLKELKSRVDYANRGGALLLGVNHPLLVAHGCSSALAIERSLIIAHEVVQQQRLVAFNRSLQQLIGKSTTKAVAPLLDETKERELS
jgi:glycerol-3-phosphate acyltransferase PlsX